jgi:hypothetical protein
VRLVTAQPVGGAELVDPGLDLALQCLEPGELIHPARQLLKVGDDQRAHRGVTLRGGDPGIAVDVIRDGYRNVLHSFTVTQFLCDHNRKLNTSWWLHDYFPATYRLVAGRTYPVERIAAVLGPVETVPVPIPADCADGFEAAYWRRPEAILDPAIWRATSALSLIPASDRAAGMARLSADLASGRWHQRYGHLLALDELDLGYCVVIARP